MNQGWEGIHRRVKEQGSEIDWGAVLTAGVVPHLRGAKALLDLGCGSGNDALRLAREGFHVVGLDISATATEQAESRAREEGLEAHFVQADMAQGLPFPESSFDGVLANLSLHYFSWERTQFVLVEVRRVLRAEGTLVMHLNSALEGEKRKAKGRVMEELEPGFYLEQGHLTRRYFDPPMLERLLVGWKVAVMELLEVSNDKGESKFCWRVVAR